MKRSDKKKLKKSQVIDVTLLVQNFKKSQLQYELLIHEIKGLFELEGKSEKDNEDVLHIIVIRRRLSERISSFFSRKYGGDQNEKE